MSDVADLYRRALVALDSGRLDRARALCMQTLTRVKGADAAEVTQTLAAIEEEEGNEAKAGQLLLRSETLLAGRSGEVKQLRLEARIRRGVLARNAARHAEALALFRRALKQAERDFGPRSAEVGRVCNEFGILCKYSGRFALGEKLYRRGLRIFERLGIASEIATLCHNLGGLEHSRRRFARGEPWARRSVEVRQKLLGPDHPAVAADAAALASLLDAQGKHDEAEPLYRRALRIFRRAYGPVHYELAVNYNNLAALEAARGRSRVAESHYRKALAMKERLLPRGHFDIAVTLNNLAALLASKGRKAEARALYRRAVRIFEQSLGPRHPDTRLCRANLAGML